MNTPINRTWPAKYSWHMISRVAPPKRSSDERIGDFHEIYSDYDKEAVQAQASRCIQCALPLCRTGCPLANRIPEWLELAAEGRFLEAAAISRSTSNMPEICSRVCPQERLCEGACILNERSEPVAIGAVERFINEYALAHGDVGVATAPPNGARVAVVGSGPGGLACADQLVKQGYSVTIFEAQGIPGGLLVNGIPSFKLGKEVVTRLIDLMKARGVAFRTGVTIGRDISFKELYQGYDAVFLGIGAQHPKTAAIPGEDLKGVYEALPFLIEKNVGTTTSLSPINVAGKRVAVLGGGDTAMDCLRSAIRSGAREAVCIYRRDLANMPGSQKEYANALEEGAAFLFLTNPVRIDGDADGKVAAVQCVRMSLGEPDSSGRRKPRAVPGSEFSVPAEVILVAYGFDPVPLTQAGFPEISTNEWGGVTVDRSLMTSVPGVFAGGDSVRGPSLVAHAVYDGRLAAMAIHQYLSGSKKTPPST